MKSIKIKQPFQMEGLFFVRRNYLLLTLYLITLLTHAQQFNIGDQDGQALTDSRLMDFLTDMRNSVGKNESLKISKMVKGSPYFTASFSPGYIRHKNDLISKTVFLRYNAFNDEIEMAASAHQTQAKEAVLKRNDIVITIGDQTFRYLPYFDKSGNSTLGYLIPVFEKNSIQLLKRLKKNYLEEKNPRTSLERAFPPRFVNEIQYYLSLNEHRPQYLGNDIKEVVKKLPPKLKDKAKAKNINLKKIKEEISLFSALNQIAKD